MCCGGIVVVGLFSLSQFRMEKVENWVHWKDGKGAVRVVGEWNPISVVVMGH